MIRILDTSRMLDKLNDKHSYFGGCIGNVAYNLIYSLAQKYGDIEIHALLDGIDFSNLQPKNLNFHILPKKKGINSVISGRYIRYIKKLLKKNEISIISQFYFIYSADFNLLREIKDYPFIIGMCELPHPLLEDEIGILERIIAGFGGKKLIFPLFKKTLEHCDVLIAVNEATKELYANHIPKSKIEVIPYGVDLDLFKYTPLPLNHNILAVSRLIRRRGLDYLIEAMPMILREYSDACLHIVGEGLRRNVLQEKAKKLGIIENITFHGNVSPKELVNLYRDCFVFCHLSFADGWNQPALEAMSTGRPVICINAPHNSMVVDGKTGYLIPFGDVNMIAEAVMKFFGDKELAEKFGAAGRRKVEVEYNWEKIAEGYYKIFCKVV